MMRDKYIEERHSPWFTTSGDRSSISDNEELAFATAKNPKEAAILADKHNDLLDAYVSVVQAWNASDPGSFNRFWYGTD